MINCGALPILVKLLTQNYKKSIKRDVCWTIANITAGIKEHIQVSKSLLLHHHMHEFFFFAYNASLYDNS